MLHGKVKNSTLKESDRSIAPLYSRHALTSGVSRYDFPENEMLPQTAYNLVHDELMLDGNSRLNLATFVTTWMEPEARQLMTETFDKNMIDGSYEPVKQINDVLDALQKEEGWDIPIHVDGASGGFIAPFIQPDLEWDFRVPRVQSINTSGHKFGLVYPGVGWIVWRDKDALPEDLIFSVNYLGGEMPTFALSFSRPGSQVVAQYYNFLRLGRDGYRRVQQTCQDVALYLSREIAKLGPFELLTEGRDLPVFAFKLKEPTNFTVFDLSERLRDRGWILPAYTFPKNLEDLAVLRVVVRDGFSHDLANMLLDDLRRHVKFFASQPGYTPTYTGGGHSHGASSHQKRVAREPSSNGQRTVKATK